MDHEIALEYQTVGVTGVAAPLGSRSPKVPRHLLRELPVHTAKAVEVQVFVPMESTRSHPHVRRGGQ